ncbi:hypothetical protein SELMODRAFT_413264 [Selaginella moellendorffii]|uniref:Pyruvate carboxyltransferase domain-containing protein n=1 Tax=Selaginella moellendorffii TaxID=88036 RepID=D8RNW2_SELML|nr:hypothetical protein SELMODRAFT_413264 [Selaginella moellendorffii]
MAPSLRQSRRSSTVANSQIYSRAHSTREQQSLPQNYVQILDTTLRDLRECASPSSTSSTSPQESRAVELIARQVGSYKQGEDLLHRGPDEEEQHVPVICGLARCVKSDIDAAWRAIRYAHKPRILAFISTSDIHMKHKLNKSPSQVLATAAEMVAYAKSLGCHDIQSDPEFLCEIFEAVIEAGATTIGIGDTVGYLFPSEIASLVNRAFCVGDHSDQRLLEDENIPVCRTRACTKKLACFFRWGQQGTWSPGRRLTGRFMMLGGMAPIFPINYVQLLSTTLRDSEQSLGVCFSIQQKLDSAKHLAKLRVDVNHDAGFLETSPQESWAVELIVVETKKAKVKWRGFVRDFRGCRATAIGFGQFRAYMGVMGTRTTRQRVSGHRGHQPPLLDDGVSVTDSHMDCYAYLQTVITQAGGKTLGDGQRNLKSTWMLQLVTTVLDSWISLAFTGWLHGADCKTKFQYYLTNVNITRTIGPSVYNPLGKCALQTLSRYRLECTISIA